MTVGFHITNEGIATSEGVIEKDHPLTFLIDYKPNDTKVFYDLNADVASLLKLIDFTPDEGRVLRDHERIYFNPWGLKYFPDIMFIVNRSYEQEAVFYNMGQTDYIDRHYTDDNSLDNAINKAKQAQDFADQVIAVYKSLGLPAKRLTSPISEFLDRKTTMNIPTYRDIPDEVNQLAENVYCGNWIETYKIGHFENTFDYDINGSYGYELTKLLDIRRGQWLHSKIRPDNAVYGFARGLITTETEFHPFSVSIDEVSYCPNGTYEITLPLQALDLLYKYALGTFKTIDAWWWIPNDKPYHVLSGVASWLWERRQGKTGIEKTIIQRIYSGLWGQMLHTRVKDGKTIYGQLYNPVYGAIVSQGSTLHLADTCLLHDIIPLNVNTDGFLTNKSIDLPTSTKLGDWKLSHSGKCIIFNSGVIAHAGKDPHGELALRYDWLHDHIQTYPKQSEYTLYSYSPVTLAMALNTKWDKLGNIEKNTKTVTIGDNKRYWLDSPDTGIDLLNKPCESMPISYDYIVSKKKIIK